MENDSRILAAIERANEAEEALDDLEYGTPEWRRAWQVWINHLQALHHITELDINRKHNL